MAEALARSDAVGLLEEAAALLRQASVGTLIYHWIGSVPFALGLLLAWNSVTSTRTSDAAWAAESLVLAILLIWMNSWRAAFAGKLRSRLSGASDQRWTGLRAWRLVAMQSFFGATKLLVLPVAALVIFPLADAVAFYRTLAVVSGREDLGPYDMMRRTRRWSSVAPRQNWAALVLLVFFQGVLTINLAIVLGVLPQLVRILTGYESAYSRGGMYFVLNPLFGLLVLAVSWLAFDPFVQAVYCVRCFRAESMETGEDLRSGLRRIRAAAPLLATLALATLAAPWARGEVAPADLEKSIHQAMQAPEYDWRFPPAAAAANAPWITRMVDRLVQATRHFGSAAGEIISRFLRWLTQRLGPGAQTGPPGAPPGAGLDWTVVGLLVLVVAAGLFFAWQRQRARRTTVARSAPASSVVVQLDADDLTADALSEDRWLELAERCLAEQNFRFALRAFYLACLSWLGRREFLSIDAGKTNRQYEKELGRRTRTYPGARDLFAENVAAFERAWYGEHPVTTEETAQFRRTMEELKATLSRPEGLPA